MFNKRNLELGSTRSVIRELFEYGKKRKAEIGADKVFDFSIGNPSIDPPKSVDKSIIALLESEKSSSLHGYTSAQGDFETRAAVAEDLNRRFGAGVSPELIYMTCGASASLTIALSAIADGDCSVVALAPYFPEYKVFAESAGARFKISKPAEDMSIDFIDLDEKIDAGVAAVIINSPNNPSGMVYDEACVKRLAELLRKKSEEFKHPIYLISDEPYRELVYGAESPFIMNGYDNTVVCYSYSKSLSLAGERIGYVAVCPRAEGAEELFLAVCGAGRAHGYVCAPSLMQRVIALNANARAAVEEYAANGKLLSEGLKSLGYEFAEPRGAFYLFVKAPDGDAAAFSDRAKAHELLIVRGNEFGVPTHARISYCVPRDTIIKAMPAFSELMKEYAK